MPPTTAQILDLLQAFPLHAQFGFTLVEHGEGTAHARCTVTDAHLNAGGIVHGGVMYLLLDVTSFCAAVTLFEPGESASTHDFHASMMRPTRAGAELDLHATVRKAGRTTLFIDVEASVDGVLVASARVTKTRMALG